jgi:hypothetical protein
MKTKAQQKIWRELDQSGFDHGRCKNCKRLIWATGGAGACYEKNECEKPQFMSYPEALEDLTPDDPILIKWFESANEPDPVLL